jgi:inner membrane transporter RhtA
MSAFTGIMPKSVSISLSICLLVIAMISLQSGASLAKSLFPLVGAQGLTSLRLGMGAFILFIIFKPWRMHFTKSNRLPLLIYGLALGGMNFLFYLALKTIPLGIAVALEFTGPLVVAMLSFRSIVDIVWIVIAALGVWLLLLPAGYHSSEIDFTGAMYALGAGACWAVYIFSGQKAGINHGPGSVAVGSLIAAVVFCPVGFAYQGDALFNPAILPVALAVAVLSTVLPYSLEMIALTRLPARTFGTLMSMEPAIAAISGLVFLNEQLNSVQWLALILIVCASIGTSLTVRNNNQGQVL